MAVSFCIGSYSYTPNVQSNKLSLVCFDELPINIFNFMSVLLIVQSIFLIGKYVNVLFNADSIHHIPNLSA